MSNSEMRPFRKFNTIKYHERSQPEARARFGLLEKKMDFKVRSKDYRAKQAQLNKMRAKAATKNEDEYYKRMHTSRLRKGEHTDYRPDKTMGLDDRVDVKVKDLKYIEMKTQSEKSKAAKLKASLQLLDESVAADAGRQHVVFKDTEEEVDNFDAAEHFDTVPELVGRSYNRLTRAQLEEGNVILNARQLKPGDLAKVDRARKAAYGELRQRLDRITELGRVEVKLGTHKKMLEGGKRKALVTKDEFGDVVSKEFKWKAERKR